MASYYDTRGKPTATVTASAKDLPLGMKFFSFADIETAKGDLDNLRNPYMEARLARREDITGLGPAIEYNHDFNFPKGTTRLGLIYEPDLSGITTDFFLGTKFFPVSTNNRGMQLGLYGRKGFNEGDIYLEGFFDYNFEPNRIVSELQIGKRIFGELYFVVEGRYSGFLEGDIGLGIGLEYVFGESKKN